MRISDWSSDVCASDLLAGFWARSSRPFSICGMHDPSNDRPRAAATFTRLSKQLPSSWRGCPHVPKVGISLPHIAASADYAGTGDRPCLTRPGRTTVQWQRMPLAIDGGRGLEESAQPEDGQRHCREKR